VRKDLHLDITLYVYHPQFITSSLIRKEKVQEVEDHIEHQRKVIQLLKDNLAIEQNRMKQKSNQHHIQGEFEVVDWVFFRLRPYK
jgi:hypothetical protein